MLETNFREYPMIVRLSLSTGRKPKTKFIFYGLNILFIILTYFITNGYWAFLVITSVLCYSVPDIYTVYWVKKFGNWEMYATQIKPGIKEQIMCWTLILILVLSVIVPIIGTFY